MFPPSYIIVQNSLASVSASATTDLTWTTVSNLGITFSGTAITIPTVGVYVLSGKVSINTALTSTCSFKIQAYYGISWTTIAYYQLSSLGTNSDFNMVPFTLAVGLPNQYIKITFINGMSSAVTLNTSATLSFFNVSRIA